ncbi:MAG: ABC transporter permease, partial [Muribaculaceae bacterium]|nr:ABC transporter permease [Muribaculaceae bacterium]
MAARYLFARKSHSAVSIIAIISVCGVALATMAIVCVLSVFNGFRSIISDRDARILPDLAITAATGSVISNADSLTDIISGVEGVEIASPVIDDNAVAYRGGLQLPV